VTKSETSTDSPDATAPDSTPAPASAPPDEALDAAGKDADNSAGDGNLGDPVTPCPAKTDPTKAHIAVHVQTASGDPLPDVTVSVTGKGWAGVTDKDGNFDFGDVAPDTYTVEGKKDGCKPASVDQTLKAPAGTMTQFNLTMTPQLAKIAVHVETPKGDPIPDVIVSVDGKGWSGTTDASGNFDFGEHPPDTYTVSGTRDKFTPSPATQNQPAPASVSTVYKLVLTPPKITQITVKVEGTKGKRDATKKRADKTFTTTSADETLAGNAPTILIRGSKDLQLEATTVPAGVPVKWSVKPNENSESAPAITPAEGIKATLKTDKAGSFSVIGELWGSKIVWNVVFAWVKVDPATSVITTSDTFFADGGSTGGSTSFKSGDFPTAKYAWQGKVKMEVFGGGTDKKLGVGKVRIHVLQNGITDTLTGNYKDGGTCLEVPKGGVPVVDATNASSPFITSPRAGKITPDNSSITDASKDREYWSGDSPAGGFLTAHKNTGKPLQSITGINEFLTAVASTSADAPDEIMVHAQTKWSADFKGDVNASGVYTPNGAKVAKDASFALISDPTGGQDACDAGFETFEPRFNGGTDFTWTP
jgi:hypothetical protein